jgi:hypothetical protein
VGAAVADALAALLPGPRSHLTRYHGVCAPHAKWCALIVPGKPPVPTLDRSPAERQRARPKAQRLARVPGEVLADIKARRQGLAPNVNGWRIVTDGGVWGTAYFRRASTALGGLGANLPEDALYPSTVADDQGSPLTGGRRYRLRFERGQLPPADAFWSLTVYGTDGFQVANPLNRFAIGDRDALQFGPDGELVLYVQHDDPGSGRRSNWLPAPPAGDFTLTIRIYAPQAVALGGQWAPPKVSRH